MVETARPASTLSTTAPINKHKQEGITRLRLVDHYVEPRAIRYLKNLLARERHNHKMARNEDDGEAISRHSWSIKSKPVSTNMSDKIPGADKKIIAGIFGILLGGLGIHKFVLGYTKEGIIQIVITLCTCGFGSILGLIEGIIYLTKSDEDFVKTYVQNKKGWF